MQKIYKHLQAPAQTKDNCHQPLSRAITNLIVERAKAGLITKILKVKSHIGIPVGQRVDREQRFCHVCASDTAEDEHHFVFDCPAYCSIRERFTAIFWGPALTLSSFFTLHDHRVIAKCLHECFASRSMLLEGVVGVPQH